jgi:hypothetical protein
MRKFRNYTTREGLNANTVTGTTVVLTLKIS